MIKTVLAIDPGLTTGWALIDYQTEKPLSWGELKTVNDSFLWDLQKLFDYQVADYLVIEDQHLSEKVANIRSVIRLSQAAGIIIGAWLLKREQDLHAGQGHQLKPKQSYSLIRASSWQKSLRLSPRAPRETRKHAARQVAKLLTGGECSENISDAICLGTFFIRNVKARQKGMVK